MHVFNYEKETAIFHQLLQVIQYAEVANHVLHVEVLELSEGNRIAIYLIPHGVLQ